MNFRTFEILESSTSPSPSPFHPFFFSESSTTSFKALNPFTPSSSLIQFDDYLTFPSPTLTSAFSLLDFPPFYPSATTDLAVQVETTPFRSRTRVVRAQHRAGPPDLCLRALSDRVSSLESHLARLLEVKPSRSEDRKYSWTAEIKGAAAERKYKWTAEIEGEDEKKGKRGERKYQWVTEVKEKGDEKRTYTWKATIGGDKNKVKEDKEKKTKKKKSGSSATRIVEIEEPDHHGVVVLRQAFAKRAEAAKNKGKMKEISPEDAAVTIQMTFRAYLIRRSQTLRALRELAVAKTKLKELRKLFHNFSYRSRVARDAEERQKFSEKIIVLLLTVDGIEGVDLMVRAAKRSMVDELEAMLEVVDPQTVGKSLSVRRRTFDMPSGDIQKEIAEGVAQVVQMLDEDAAL